MNNISTQELQTEEFGVRIPAFQKPFQPNSVTYIVACVCPSRPLRVTASIYTLS